MGATTIGSTCQRRRGTFNPVQRERAARFADARALASLRVVVSALILISPELHHAPYLAARPELLDSVPEGAHWLAALPLTPSSAQTLRVIALSSGALALLGFYSRIALAVLTLAAVPLYALSQLSGAVIHDMHLFWFSGLLALSPCGDAWSLDGWGTEPERSVREYAVPVALCRALLGVVYFFPGVHKLLESGWQWAAAPHVVAQMHAKWFQMAELPWLRIDRYPQWCSLGGHLVLLFELSFLPLICWRRTRPLAAAMGLAFHASTQVFLFIPFMSLWACYVVLAPFHLLAPRQLTEVPHVESPSKRTPWPALLFGGAVLALAIVQGVRGQTQAWPIACYPTFAAIVGDTLPDLLIEAESPSGERLRFTGRERGPRSQEEWGRVFRISGAYGGAPDASALREHALSSAQRAAFPVAPGSTLRVFRADFATAPELWGSAPRNETLLITFRIPP
jgi:Vitamin K-dependent gamma-carboxylase